VEFRLLGRVEAEHEGIVLDLGRRRERCLLGILLLGAGAAVPVERLVSLLWDDAPPPAARASLHAHVSRLRRRLDPGNDGALGVRLLRRDGGYVAEVPPASTDAGRFHALVDRARALPDPAERSAGLRQGLALWRGPLLADAASDCLRERIGPQLTEGRLMATELAIEADLAAGRSAEAAAELTALVSAHPLRERLRAQLMLALYRCGRQADALQAFHDARELLAGELGIEPGPELRQMQERILAADPELAAPARAAELPGHQRSDLPGDIADFTGRETEMRRLLDVLSGDAGAGLAVVISAIDGMAGIGKTALAVHLAHKLAERYPDARLFIDLHAHTADRKPVRPAAALDMLLRALGVPSAKIPREIDERARMWRAELAGRKALVVLDNAASAAQVRPLLPGAPGCLVLITSRRRLTDLEAARSLSLDVLPPGDAAALFTRAADVDHAAADPGAAADVVRLCGYLPLAIRIAAARLRGRPAWTTGHLAGRLAERESRLGELSVGDRSVAAAFTLSYQDLSPGQQLLFRLLGLVPCPEFGACVAAALCDTSLDQAGRLLEELVDAHLLQEPAPDRYRFHDLLRHHAEALARQTEPDAVRRAAVGRVLDYYLQATARAMAHVDPRGTQITLGARRETAPTPIPGSRSAALAWLDDEYGNLIAVIGYAGEEGWPNYAWQLPCLLQYFFDIRGHAADWISTHRLALVTVHHLADRQAEAEIRKGLGLAYWILMRCDEALDQHRQSLALYCAAGNRLGEGDALNNLGLVHERLGQYVQARSHYERSLAIRLAAGDGRGRAATLLNLGNVHDRLGRYTVAAEHYRQAMVIFQEIGDQRSEAIVLGNLGMIHERLEQHDDAIRHFRQSLAITAKSGDHRISSHNLTNLGNVFGRLGRHAEAAVQHLQALALARETGDRGAEGEILNNLGDTRCATGHLTEALALHHQALALAREVRDRHEEARAHHGAGTALQVSDPGSARQQWAAALAIYRELGVPEADALRDQLESTAKTQSHLSESAASAGEPGRQTGPAWREP
jgi:DNA-binding SARP family transcriptional activator/tetratricopeptide (TPR) repeat protein